MPTTVLLEAGFVSVPVLAMMVEHNIEVLCPTGQATSAGNWERRAGRGGRFPQQAFEYLPEREVYRCPGERELVYEDVHLDTFHRKYRLYRGTRCGDCQLRERCTESKYGRGVRRYEGAELKAAMAQVLRQAAARAKYQRRRSIVEPRFAEFRERQALVRFHRRGLAAVRVEFALHCLAFKRKKAARGSSCLSCGVGAADDFGAR